MKESRLEKQFIEGLEDYPFATHIQREVSVSGGRADIRLPDYNVVIESKGSDGRVKSAVGQVLWYAEELEDTPYILIPADKITVTTKSVCDTHNIGILTATKVPRIVKDVGGLEPFNMYEFQGGVRKDPEPNDTEPRKEVVAGPSYETIETIDNTP
jgi:hypothetical protein